MTDGTGTTPYTYVPIGSLGALQLQQESSPLANSAIAYAYDELGRLARTPAGGGSAVMVSYLWCGSDICQVRYRQHADSQLLRGRARAELTGRTMVPSIVA
ncbi:MAG: hypothetical protein JSR91_02945 [Proteobacteria bacterium]|nr:hypothetical protein [Pseudomonadota bacterium]